MRLPLSLFCFECFRLARQVPSSKEAVMPESEFGFITGNSLDLRDDIKNHIK